MAGVLWSFNVGYADNWHPLTWLSHTLDCQLFGLSPGGHHATNVLLHAFSAMLLFLVLHRMTKTFWRAALVAALFAWHPLRVESVAWVSERKDVLSGVFWMLTMWAYVRYAEECKMQNVHHVERGKKCKIYYALALFLFVLGLMAKPMLVTLPFVLLLLDWWPLHRISFGPGTAGPEGPISPPAKSARFLLTEKIPFFFLSLVSCVLTLAAQRGAIESLARIPLSFRLMDAARAYYKYIEKTIWPSKLAVIYPMNLHGMGWDVVWACLFVAVLSATAFRLRNSRPYWLAGWLWYLGTLVPVLNLVHIGSQAMADRYTYIPSIGLLLILCWDVHDLSAAWPFRRLLLGVLGAAAVAACLVATRTQLQYWKNGGALFSHAIEVTPRNIVALVNDAAYLREHKQPEEARLRCEEALRIFPNYAGAHFILGAVFAGEGKLDEAAAELETALRLDSSRHAAHAVLGAVELARNMPAQAQQHFTAALTYDPANPDVRAGLGKALAMQGRLDEASAQFVEALRFAPQNLDTRYQLAVILARQRKAREAIAQYEFLLRLQPDYSDVLNNLAWLLATDPRPEFRDGNKAVGLAARACSLTHHQQPAPLQTLSAACAEAGRFDEAIAAARQAHDLALAQGKPDIAAKNVELLELYRARQPYRE
jgi:Tfp pilus assembly protein PilF